MNAIPDALVPLGVTDVAMPASAEKVRRAIGMAEGDGAERPDPMTAN